MGGVHGVREWGVWMGDVDGGVPLPGTGRCYASASPSLILARVCEEGVCKSVRRGCVKRACEEGV